MPTDTWFGSEASGASAYLRREWDNSRREDRSLSLRGLLDRCVAWVLENWLERGVLPILLTALRFVAFFVLSVLAYVAFYRWLVPAALAQEPVYV